MTTTKRLRAEDIEVAIREYVGSTTGADVKFYVKGEPVDQYGLTATVDWDDGD